MSNTSYIIDFDSTFVKIEALDTLAELVLANNSDKNKILDQIKAITNQGMDGTITFTQSLQNRLALFAPSRHHIHQLIDILNQNITNSIQQNQNWFIQNAKNIYIISGGFKEYIIPVVQPFGIIIDQILANEFIFDQHDNVITFDPQNYLSQPQGKVKAVASLQLQGEIIVIGDGYTDYEIKEHGKATAFYAFTENISRESVVHLSDQNISSFALLSSQSAQETI